MRQAPHSSGHIFGQCPDVGAFTATNRQIGFEHPARFADLDIRPGKILQVNFAGLTLHFNAGPRQFVERLSIALERGIHGRDLFGVPGKLTQNALKLFGCG